MTKIRAFTETPQQPHRASLFTRIVGLPGRIATAALSGLGRLHLAPHLDGAGSDDDLWYLLLASDPDGIWLPWPAAKKEDPS